MKNSVIKRFLMASFLLNSATGLSPAFQVHAEEAIRLPSDNDYTTMVQDGGTKDEADARSNVTIYDNSKKNALIYTNNSIAFHINFKEAAEIPKAGDMLQDGTIYAGDNFAATATDAALTYKWKNGKQYCEELIANGYDDWSLPTKTQLNRMYNNKNIGSFVETFDETGLFPNGWYWTSTEPTHNLGGAWIKRFSDGYEGWHWKEDQSSVRCVRKVDAP